jgi:hypothetical protein
MAVVETQEDIDARMAQELIDSGDVHDPVDDDLIDDAAAAASAVTAKLPEINADTLADIAGSDKPKMVPHSRFNEVNEEAKTHRARVLQLEEELARAKGGASTPAPGKDETKPVPYDYDAAEELYSAAILDGDTAKAKSIRAEIRTNERTQAVREAEEAADRRYTENRQKDDLARAKTERDLAIEKAYVAFPFLDSASADANQDAIDEVLALTNLYTGKGKSVGEALTAAVAKVGPRYAPAVTEKPAITPKPDLQKGIERAAQIPPKGAGLGTRTVSTDVRKMTGAEIKKLSKEEDARLGGDEI